MRGKRPLPWIEIQCVEHAQRLLSDRILTSNFMLCGLTLNNSGITVKKCAGHSGLKSQSANMSWGMRFEECHPRLWTAVGSERVSTHGRGLFSRTRQPSERKRKETSDSRETKPILLQFSQGL